jgi:hypothetical protein
VRVTKPTWCTIIVSLLSHYTSTCFGLANSPSPGGSKVYTMWQLVRVVRLRPRLHRSLNQHNTTFWTYSKQGSRNLPHYCLCQRLQWNRPDWNVVSQQLPTVWRQQSGFVSTRRPGQTLAAICIGYQWRCNGQMFNLQYSLNLSGNSIIYLAQFKIFSIISWFPKQTHPPSSSVSVLPANVTICQQKFVPIIIRRVHHAPFMSLKISRLRT